jgi:hypothetical protein
MRAAISASLARAEVGRRQGAGNRDRRLGHGRATRTVEVKV